MGILSLSNDNRRALPDELEGHKINPDFRNILRILRILGNPRLSEGTKSLQAKTRFYENDAPQNALALMIEFISAGRSPEGDDKDEEARMDFEFDADEIYCSFVNEYDIDLMETDMHWYKFLTLLGGLSPECALSRKISLRTGGEEVMKGLKGKKREDMARAIERAQIPERAKTMQEAVAEKAFEEKWSQV
jgi:hypothetical protein